MHATRLFAVTMDDAVATLGEAAATMSNFYRRAKSSESGDICCDRIIEKHEVVTIAIYIFVMRFALRVMPLVLVE